MFRKLTITTFFSLCLHFVYAQTTRQIDLGTIGNFEPILNNASFYIDYGKDASINEIWREHFSYPDAGHPFEPANPDAQYFMRVEVSNSGTQDTFWLYMGKAQQYTMYAYDSSTGKINQLQNLSSTFSYALFNELPHASFVVKHGEHKIFYIQAKINFYNGRLYDPVIIIPEEQTSFIFDYLLQPTRIYIFVSALLLGIMLSLFLSFASFFFRTLNRDYLYYTLALLCYLLYFSLRIFDNFAFSNTYWFFYDARLQLLQIGGSIFILLFVLSFLQIRKTLPGHYKYFRIIVLLQIIFLAINIPLTYTNYYHNAGTVSFNVLRLFILPYFILLIFVVLRKIKSRESWYIGLGSLISIIFFLIALYADVMSDYKSDYISHREIALLAFTTGILIQMRFFMEAIIFRTTTQNNSDIRELEKLKFEKERTEFEKQNAIINAREKERNRISQEIHDDIGSGLTSIRLLSEIAQTRNNQSPKKELEKISSTSNLLIDKMNEIIWTLNSRNDSLPNLVSFLRHFTVEFFEPLPILLQVSIPENIPEINIKGKSRRNILLCVKESLHNIVKHSQATEVNVDFGIDGSLSIKIKDNGIGFQPSSIGNHRNGLNNIRERIFSIGGSCNISGIGGTSVELIIPLQ